MCLFVLANILLSGATGSIMRLMTTIDPGTCPSILLHHRLLRLWDRQWRLLWDGASAVTPAYQHISTAVFATIDEPDGSRWVGEFWRCPEGIRSAPLPSPAEFDRGLRWWTFEQV